MFFIKTPAICRIHRTASIVAICLVALAFSCASAQAAAPRFSGNATEGGALKLTRATTKPIQWLRCSSSGGSCVKITRATKRTYYIRVGDIRKRIRVRVGTSVSGASAVVTARRTALVALPEISGLARVGQTLTSSHGTWRSSVSLSYSYIWKRCDSDGDNCTTIPGETSSTYVVDIDDLGSKLRTTVTTTTYCGCAVSASSTLSGTVAFASFPGTVDISGDAELAQELTATVTPTWTLPGDVTVSYVWMRCNSLGASCSDTSIVGDTFTLTGSEIGKTMRARATLTWPEGSISGNSDQTDVVIVGPPVNSAIPTISGTLSNGNTLTAADGTWSTTSQHPTTRTRVWQRCDANATTNCVDIGGATSTTYLLAAADVGKSIRVVVTGTNTGGSTSANSDVTAPIATNPPVNTVLPSITGTPEEGGTLTAANGTWTGANPKVYTYQWQLCDNAGANCADIVGETDSTYVVLATDIGSTLVVIVTATNSDLSVSATSGASAEVEASPPSNTDLPEITGGTDYGDLLTVSDGTWIGTSPITFTYQWYRCGAPGFCQPIFGETNNTYTLDQADVDGYIAAEVIASNVEDDTSAMSAEVGPITHYLAPDNQILPRVLGTLVEGETVTVDDGTWLGDPAVEFSYQWLTCDNVGDGCTPIPGQNTASYVLTGDDVGLTVRVEVTGTNVVNSETVNSQESMLIEAAPPLVPPNNTAAPSVGGTTVETLSMYASVGTWEGSDPMTFTIQWQRCDSEGTNCYDIAAATDISYVLDNQDIGNTVRVYVTATNDAGTDSAYSPTSDIVFADTAPVNLTLPTIGGEAQFGNELTATEGGWIGTPTITYGYRWYRCDNAGNNCTKIVGAVFTSYTLTVLDLNVRLRVEVTAANDLGTTIATSAPSMLVNDYVDPFNTVDPSISGLAVQSVTLIGDIGTWVGEPVPTFEYQWLRCDLAGDNCIDIANANGTTYQLTLSDVGNTVRFEVTGTNDGGSAVGTSPESREVEPAFAPEAVGAPHLSGYAVETQMLTATEGVWYGYPTPTATLQWLQCDAVGDNCTEIVGATATTYYVTTDDIGYTIRVRSDAVNSIGSASVTGDESEVIQPFAVPTNTITPVLSGYTVATGQMTVDTGSWTGTSPIEFSYQWMLCDNTGANCADIDHATNETYTVDDSDIGGTLRAKVTALNLAGSTTDTSQESRVIVAYGVGGPFAEKPTIDFGATGVPEETIAMIAVPGEITGATDTSWRWLKCDAVGANCVEIIGATQTSYIVTNSDIGSTFRLRLTASNPYGSTTVTSDASGVAIAMSLPANTVLPTAGGTYESGQTLSADPGTWTGTPTPITFTYRWQACDNAGANCVNKVGETEATYTLRWWDVGETVRVIVYARNVAGIVQAESAATPVILPEP